MWAVPKPNSLNKLTQQFSITTSDRSALHRELAVRGVVLHNCSMYVVQEGGMQNNHFHSVALLLCAPLLWCLPSASYFPIIVIIQYVTCVSKGYWIFSADTTAVSY